MADSWHTPVWSNYHQVAEGEPPVVDLHMLMNFEPHAFAEYIQQFGASESDDGVKVLGWELCDLLETCHREDMMAYLMFVQVLREGALTVQGADKNTLLAAYKKLGIESEQQDIDTAFASAQHVLDNGVGELQRMWCECTRIYTAKEIPAEDVIGDMPEMQTRALQRHRAWGLRLTIDALMKTAHIFRDAHERSLSCLARCAAAVGCHTNNDSERREVCESVERDMGDDDGGDAGPVVDAADVHVAVDSDDG